MVDNTQLESHHGVLMRIADTGVLIIGPAGIGKSSLALELISQGHSLIADDVVEFSQHSNTVIGHCPPLLEGLLHTRELGLISIPAVFGKASWQKQCSLNVVVALQSSFTPNSALTVEEKVYIVQSRTFPLLTVSTDNPASLSHRIQCWLKMQAQKNTAEHDLKQRQKTLISSINHRELS